MYHILCRIFGKTSNHPSDATPLQSRFGTLQILTLPKTEITFEREDISDCQWNSGKFPDEGADENWENCVRFEGTYFEGDWVILSYVQCLLYLVSYSINISIFHSTWLDTFWTYLIFLHSLHFCGVNCYFFKFLIIFIWILSLFPLRVWLKVHQSCLPFQWTSTWFHQSLVYIIFSLYVIYFCSDFYHLFPSHFELCLWLIF